jgi:hypothetical protein
MLTDTRISETYSSHISLLAPIYTLLLETAHSQEKKSFLSQPAKIPSVTQVTRTFKRLSSAGTLVFPLALRIDDARVPVSCIDDLPLGPERFFLLHVRLHLVSTVFLCSNHGS